MFSRDPIGLGTATRPQNALNACRTPAADYRFRFIKKVPDNAKALLYCASPLSKTARLATRLIEELGKGVASCGFLI